VTNLSITKTPYVSGSFRFDTPVSSADGKFAINLTEGRSRIGMIRLLFQLGKGRFLGIEGNHHWSLPGVEISSSKPFFLELDGEVLLVEKVSFSMHPEQINLCTAVTE
jgi:diacylglycerol kinase family enzyme|tara:strand:+ start:126 stop:449 length:324 start_codon:yes stop_codon:yes gene_type:complete